MPKLNGLNNNIYFQHSFCNSEIAGWFWLKVFWKMAEMMSVKATGIRRPKWGWIHFEYDCSYGWQVLLHRQLPGMPANLYERRSDWPRTREPMGRQREMGAAYFFFLKTQNNLNRNLEKSKLNITRDIEIKNNLTVTRGEVGRDNGGKWVRVFRNNNKGHIDKTKAGWKQGREVGLAGVEGEVVVGKHRQL